MPAPGHLALDTADCALVSRATLYKIERGDPGVGFGLYAKVLQAYGLLERLTVIVDGRFDAPGLAMERARLPRRVHPGTDRRGDAR
jgi:hypothetical protein